MACLKPLQAFHKLGGGITWTPERSNGVPLTIPCGQCLGCRLDRQSFWALRLVHESKMHTEGCFITLTYSDEFLPPGSTLVKSHVQDFMRKLRKRISPRKVRFFASGEYGPKDLRPHYHALIFGWEPGERKLHSKQEGYSLYTSPALSAVWEFGYSQFGYITPETCSYVARYTVDKVNGEAAVEHYTRILRSGEMISVQPEFSLMSRRPGIGHDFYRAYQDDFRNYDHAILAGRKKKIPPYYDKLLKRDDELRHEALKLQRKKKARANRAKHTPERLAAREKIIKASIALHRKDNIK